MTMDWRKFGRALLTLALCIGSAIGIAGMVVSTFLVLRIIGIAIMVVLFLFTVASLSGSIKEIQ